uniref:transketolase-like TK C-terminal-containing protein n=1 Tax=Sandarakinorhabdus oryzae TaxID=2675220 RepID=UPI0038B483C3
IAGGYWLREPAPGAEAAIVAMGALLPEALAAWEALREDVPGLGLLSVTSPDLLHRGWRAGHSHVEALLSPLRAGGKLVTLCDAAPASLSWLGSVHGHRVVPLGVDRFGQTGDLVDLFAAYALDPDAIITAMARALSA